MGTRERAVRAYWRKQGLKVVDTTEQRVDRRRRGAPVSLPKLVFVQGPFDVLDRILERRSRGLY